MKPNELRVGNYVYPNQAVRIYANIREIKRATVMFTDYLEVDIDSLVPIPLTEELLLKCGFIKNEDDIFHLQWSNGFGKPKTIGIELEGGESFASFHIGEGVDMMLIDVHHLHQLQNFFYAITGEELEINL